MHRSSAEQSLADTHAVAGAGAGSQRAASAALARAAARRDPAAAARAPAIRSAPAATRQRADGGGPGGADGAAEASQLPYAALAIEREYANHPGLRTFACEPQGAQASLTGHN